MVLWLVGTAVSIQSLREDTAGILFGQKIPVQDYAQALNAVTRQAILTHGDKYRQQVSAEEMERQAWERLVLLAEARRKKIRASDREVVAELQRWPIFQRNGQFDPGTYQAIIQYSLGAPPRVFEEEIRQSILIWKLTEAAVNIPVTDQELKETFQRREESIRVSYIALPQESAAREIADSIRKDPQGMERIAQQADLKVVTTDLFKQATQIPGLEVTGATFDAAFSLKIGEIAGPLESPKGWLVARLEAKQPADEKLFPQMKEDVRRELISQKRLGAYVTWYADLFKRANLKKLPPNSPLNKGKPKNP